MKLTALFLLGGCLHLNAKGIGQTITLSLRDAPIEKVFREIERQTNFTFFVESNLLKKAKRVTISAYNLPLNQVLDLCFKDQPFIYSFSGKTITIKVKAEKDKKEDRITAEQIPPLIDIKGQVLNISGEPIVGATVAVQGTTKQTTTDDKGEFILNSVNEKSILVISHVQYEIANIALNGNHFVKAILQIKINSLDELQVIAYGTTTKRFNTGNVNSVKASTIQNQPINNPILALAGRVPGLFITQANGLPGSGITVRIQGQNSIGKGNDPLYVIDGVPYPAQPLSAISGFIWGGAPSALAFLNPSDIESIEVLKDADATAIYGSRAANGAILISTKKGKAGQVRVTLNMQSGLGRVTQKMHLLNTEQYLTMRHEGIRNDNASVLTTDYDINNTWDTTRYTDWQKVLLGNTSKYSDAQAMISGGNNSTQYLISSGFHRETTVFPGDFNDQKGSIHFNINSTSLNQRFKIQFSGNYLIDNNKLPTQDLTQNALTLAPDAPAPLNPDGSVNWAPLPNGNSSFTTNPFRLMVTKYNSKTNNLLSNVVLSYELFKGLDFKTSLGYNRNESEQINLSPITSVAPEYRANFVRTTSFAKGEISSWIIEPQLTYGKNIKNGKLDVLIGTTFQSSKNNYQQFSAKGFNSDRVMEDLNSATSITPFSTIISNYKYNALFGRINYIYRNKYLINFNTRRDGSSRFGSENLFNNFWSIAGGWIFSAEKFMTEKFPIISFGKLRASYGTTGNDQIGDYQFLNRYQAVSGISVAYQNVSSLEPNGIPNPYLQWEETRKLQFGLDLSFLKDRLSLNVNYNRNRSSNQLLSYPLPIVTGVSGFTSNYPATIQNTGWEVSVSTENIQTRNFKWSSSFNITIPKNELLEFPNIEKSSSANTLFVGEPFTIFRALKFLGVNPANGIYVFADSKGNATSSPSFSTDRKVLINTSPEFYGGFQNSFTYKGFELSVFFQFVKQIGSNYFLGAQKPGAYNTNQPVYVLDRWQKPGDITNIQRFSSNSTLNTSYTYGTTSDAVYRDASFLRLKNASFSWVLPTSYAKKAHLQNLKLFALGQNLFTVTKYKGLDPETKVVNGLPLIRVTTIGLQLGL